MVGGGGGTEQERESSKKPYEIVKLCWQMHSQHNGQETQLGQLALPLTYSALILVFKAGTRRLIN
jgi:hypothetical protein